MKRYILAFAPLLALLLSSCNELPMEQAERGPAPYAPDYTGYLPQDRGDPYWDQTRNGGGGQ